MSTFRIRAFKGNVNVLVKANGRWVRVFRADGVLDRELFVKLSEYARNHGVKKHMRTYGSRYYTTYYEAEVTLDELRKLLGERIQEVLQGGGYA